MVCRRGRDSIYTPMTAPTDLYVSVIQQRSAVTLIFAVFLQPVCNKLMVFLSENVAFRSQLNRLFKMRATPKTSQRETKCFSGDSHSVFWSFQVFLNVFFQTWASYPQPPSLRGQTEKLTRVWETMISAPLGFFVSCEGLFSSVRSLEKASLWNFPKKNHLVSIQLTFTCIHIVSAGGGRTEKNLLLLRLGSTQALLWDVRVKKMPALKSRASLQLLKGQFTTKIHVFPRT